MKLATKLLLGVISIFLLAIVIFSGSAYFRLKADSDKEIADFKANQEEKLKADLKNYMDIAFKQLEANYRDATEKEPIVQIYGPRLKNVIDMAYAMSMGNLKMAKEGQISVEEAQHRSLEAIRAMRYDNGAGYIWIARPDKPLPTVLMHPTNPAAEGRSNTGSVQDIVVDGVHRNFRDYYIETVEKSSGGEAFISYLYRKPGKDVDEPKLSYFKFMKEWNWIFGTGIYIDEVVAEAQIRAISQVKSIRYDNGNGYFWISDLGKPIPKVLMHPLLPELEGKVGDTPRYNCVGAKRENLLSLALNECGKSASGDGFIEYLWSKDIANESKPDRKITYARIFKPYGWLLGTGVQVAPFIDVPLAAKKRDNNRQLESILLTFAISGVLLTILCASVMLFLVRRLISSPLGRITVMSKFIADGDIRSAASNFSSLSAAISEGGEVDVRLLPKDETGSLIASIAAMTRNLNALVGQVQRSTIQLASSATELSASSRVQETSINEFGASTNQIVASSKEISATSQHLVMSMNEVAEVSSRTAGRASEGQGKLGEMESMMRLLSSATESICSKLSVINEKANNINTVVATVTKVADQTNLLSLNAAIEAEKAGEFGKGFTVVAREVRRLADQTAVATLDIARMVKEMQSAVSSGVMEMDKFSEEVRRGVKETSSISEQLGRIIDDVQSLPPVFSNVIDGMKQQASGAQQISESMVQLSDGARQTAESLREFNEATAQLNNATHALQNEISTFKVKEGRLEDGQPF